MAKNKKNRNAKKDNQSMNTHTNEMENTNRDEMENKKDSDNPKMDY